VSSNLFVILNAVKNPSGLRPPSLVSEYPTGFFAALRMTGFEYLKDLKTIHGHPWDDERRENA
jgi:hypothetical protein